MSSCRTSFLRRGGVQDAVEVTGLEVFSEAAGIKIGPGVPLSQCVLSAERAIVGVVLRFGVWHGRKIPLLR